MSTTIVYNMCLVCGLPSSKGRGPGVHKACLGGYGATLVEPALPTPGEVEAEITGEWELPEPVMNWDRSDEEITQIKVRRVMTTWFE